MWFKPKSVEVPEMKRIEVPEVEPVGPSEDGYTVGVIGGQTVLKVHYSGGGVTTMTMNEVSTRRLIKMLQVTLPDEPTTNETE